VNEKDSDNKDKNSEKKVNKELIVYNDNNDKVDLSKLSDTYMIQRIIQERVKLNL